MQYIGNRNYLVFINNKKYVINEADVDELQYVCERIKNDYSYEKNEEDKAVTKKELTKKRAYNKKDAIIEYYRKLAKSEKYKNSTKKALLEEVSIKFDISLKAVEKHIYSNKK